MNQDRWNSESIKYLKSIARSLAGINNEFHELNSVIKAEMFVAEKEKESKKLVEALEQGCSAVEDYKIEVAGEW